MQTKNLFSALADFQNEISVIAKQTKGYGYKYADLPTIFAEIKPLLKKHNLGFTQLVGDYNVTTVLFHTPTGESVSTKTEIPKGIKLKNINDFQVLGSGITYIRRYAISAILGIITDEDTDGAGEQEHPQSKPEITKEAAVELLKSSVSLKQLVYRFNNDIGKWKNYEEIILICKNLKEELYNE